MTQVPHMNRRAALAGLGLSVSFLARQAVAGDGQKKLITVVCRGGMDGLSVSPPVGDRDYKGLRQAIAVEEAVLTLDGTFGLHPSLAAVHALAKSGQARIAPAIASPDRARSHFEAQDVLESGGSVVYGTTTGWLNRAVSALARQGKIEALSVGATAPLILRGPAAVSSWSPGREVDVESRLPMLLQDLYRDDPVLGPALARGLATETMAQKAIEGMGDKADQADMMMSGGGIAAYSKAGRDAAESLGTTVAGFMREPAGPQIAAISLDGFDTHANQGAAEGQLSGRLANLNALLKGLQSGLGPEWKNTVIVVATEFGRTARINGTGGTDHGTASTAMLLGGSLKPGGIVGDWPTLKASALFEGRDLAPTLDIRALFKGVLADQMGLDRRVLDNEVFPDSAGIAALKGLV